MIFLSSISFLVPVNDSKNPSFAMNTSRARNSRILRGSQEKEDWWVRAQGASGAGGCNVRSGSCPLPLAHGLYPWQDRSLQLKFSKLDLLSPPPLCCRMLFI